MIQERRSKFIRPSIKIALFLMFSVLLFVIPASAATGVSDSVIGIGNTTELEVETLSGVQSVTWKCSPAGVVTFGTNVQNAYSCTTQATGAKFGSATVTAVITYQGNLTSTITVGTVHVVLQDGVYSIRNNYSDNYYTGNYYLRKQLTVSENSSTSDLHLSQNVYGDVTNNLFRYWKINHLGNGEYTIRSLDNDGKALTLSGSSAVFADVGATVPDNARWYIRGNNIIPKTSTSKCLTLSTPDPDTGTYFSEYNYFGVNVRTIGYMEFENWSFTKVNDLHGALFRKNSTGELFTTFTGNAEYYEYADGGLNLNELGYSLVIYDAKLRSVVIGYNRASGDFFPANFMNTSSDNIEINHGGTSNFSLDIIIGDFEVTLNKNFSLNIITDFGIKDNSIYSIKNANSGRYISLQEISDANSVNVSTRTNSTNLYSQWKVEKQNGLEYQLITRYGSASRVLNVSGTNINIYADTNSPSQTFKIQRIQSGSLCGLYYIRYGEYYVTENSANNVCLTLTPTNASAWSFSKVTKGNVEKFGFVYSYTESGKTIPYDSTIHNSKFINEFYFLGYSPYVHINDTPQNFKNRLPNSEVLIFASHGFPGIMGFYDENCNNSPIGAFMVSGVLSFSYNLNLPAEAQVISKTFENNSLASARCIVLLGCQTGVTHSGHYNLADSLFQKGAHFVVGSTETIRVSSANTFEDSFIENLDNPSISDIINAINDGSNIFKYQPENPELPDETSSIFPGNYIGDSIQSLQ